MNVFRQIAELGPKRKALNVRFVFVSVISSIGYLQYGYSFWISTNLVVRMNKTQNTTSQQLGYEYRSPSQFDVLLNHVAVPLVFTVGGIVGSLCTGPLLNGCGRKATLIFNNFLSIACAVIMSFSKVTQMHGYNYFSVGFTGICSGIASCAVPVYLGEISPRRVRGAVICFMTLFFALGSTLAQVLIGLKGLATQEGLTFLMIISGSMSAVAFIILPFFPESPRYLLIQKNQKDKAIEALKNLRGTDNLKAEIEDMDREDMNEKAEKGMTLIKLLCFPSLRWHIISIMVLLLGQQFSGISVVYSYSKEILLQVGVQPQFLPYVLFTSSIFVILIFSVLTYIIDSVGRRKTLLLGFGINSFLCVLLTMSLELQRTVPWMSYISTFSIYIFLIGQNIGPGAVPNVLMVEMFLQSSRAPACVLGKAVQWFGGCLRTILFLFIQNLLGTYVFLIFWPICTFTLIYIFKMIPETKQMTFLDISRVMTIQISKTIKGYAGQGSRRRSTQASIRGRQRRQSLKR